VTRAHPKETERVPGGVVHELPEDLRKALIDNPVALEAWQDITPLARNEFICWVEDANRATDSRAPHPPDPGGARGGSATPLLLAGLHAPRTHRHRLALVVRGPAGAPTRVFAL
jgi:hypothetical protein